MSGPKKPTQAQAGEAPAPKRGKRAARAKALSPLPALPPLPGASGVIAPEPIPAATDTAAPREQAGALGAADAQHAAGANANANAALIEPAERVDAAEPVKATEPVEATQPIDAFFANATSVAGVAVLEASPSAPKRRRAKRKPQDEAAAPPPAEAPARLELFDASPSQPTQSTSVLPWPTPAPSPGPTSTPAPTPTQRPQPPSAVAHEEPGLHALRPCATGGRVGPWRLLGPMTSHDARVARWRAQRADFAERTEQVPAPLDPAVEPGSTLVGGTAEATGLIGLTGEVILLLPIHWRARPDLAQWLTHTAGRVMRLAHPNLARVLDVGIADDGTPWVATEMVEGQAIHLWCHDRAPALAERRTLCEQAADAAQHAHAGLVLHGRIHPSQLIVTPQRRLCWLNFGLEELLEVLGVPEAGAAETTLGAPPAAYAAPEQRDGGAHSVAGDIHALGLVLFEVLAGGPAWLHGSSQAPAAGEAAARERPPWPRPSQVAGAGALKRALRGDLDAIIGKALRADPAQRYASAADLLADLRRSRMHRLVSAREDAGFRDAMGRMARRWPWRFGLAAVLVGSVVLGLAGLAAWGASSARQARQMAAQASLRDTSAVNALWLQLLRDNGATGMAIGMATDWPQTLARAEGVARASLAERPAQLAVVLAALGREQVDRGAYALGRQWLNEALPRLEEIGQIREAQCAEAWAQVRQGEQRGEAEQRLRRASEDPKARPLVRALCTARVADLEHGSGQPRLAHQTANEAWRLLSQAPERTPQLALRLAAPIGPLSVEVGRYADANRWFERALKLAAELKLDAGPLAVNLRDQWAAASLASGDAKRAMELADANLIAVVSASSSPSVASMSTLSLLLQASASSPAPAAPAPPAAPALSASASSAGPNGEATSTSAASMLGAEVAMPAMPHLLTTAAEPRLELNLLGDAKALLQRAVATADSRGDRAVRVRARCLLGRVALREGDSASAARWIKEAAAAAADRGGDVLADADAMCRLAGAELSLQQGRPGEAQREAERLIATSEKSPRWLPPATLVRAEATLGLAAPERALSAALHALREARALQPAEGGETPPRGSFRSGQAALLLSEAHRGVGDIEAAKETLAFAVQQLGATLPETHPWRRRAESAKEALAARGKQ